MTHALGIDLGTTATKAVVIDAGGTVLAEAERPSDLSSPHPGWAEEDTAVWWSNVCELCRELPTDQVRAIGVSGMVPAVIAVDEELRPLRPAILQNDARADREVVELAEELPAAELLQRTGSSLTHQSVAPTARWLAHHEPEVWARKSAIVGSYDYLAGALTGVIGVERNWALESGLFDMHTEAWAPDLCACAGLDVAAMPVVREATEIVGAVSARAAEQTTLAQGTPVVAGSADHVAAALAAGVLEPGQALLKLGGAGDILLASDRAVIDRRLYLDYHLIPGRWLPNGCMAASGSFLKWFARELAPGASLAELDREAEAVPAGARGIVALPYMLGEKTPIHDPLARGVFAGLHLGHTRADLYRAAVESIAYGFRHHFDVFDELGCEVATVRVGDGGASSQLFTSVVSSVLGRPLEPLLSRSSSAIGVAFTAAIGAGLIEHWSSIERFTTVGPTIEPDPRAREAYDRGYAIYRDLYESLAPLLHRAAHVDEAEALS
jgi:xylulokinase